MERESSWDGENYLTSPVVAKILGVSNDFLSELVEHGVVRPLREPMLNGRRLWGPEQVFRAFLGLRLANEFKMKYGNGFDEYMFDQVRRDLLSTKRQKGSEILESKEWTVVARKASKVGLNL